MVFVVFCGLYGLYTRREIGCSAMFCSDGRLEGGEVDLQGSQEEERGSYAGGQRQCVMIGISVFLKEG
ncbi:uncharacterized protein EAF02_010333 [Botrytis sinoallii]|uniref:uncharacterized protein n=1 Tax=Botrytis sinoallii TaxID=1463999 RepID=UPI0018FFBE53|nr:uncharacterized protein EAF02_010333 [Botrytis sinoallii]KAF7862784.1 hypothetical protein EAF02_010333 [Botrytis sinoallii]